MNIKQYRRVNKVGAAFFCLAGLLTTSFALAGGGEGDHGGEHEKGEVEIKKLDCELTGSIKNKDLALKVKGLLKGYTHKKVEVEVKVKGFVKTVCETPSGNEIPEHAQGGDKQWFEADNSEWVGPVKGKEEFKIWVDVSEELHHKGKGGGCQGEGLVEKRKVVITDVIVKVFSKSGELLDKEHCEPDSETGRCSMEK